ncbi:MAG: lipopolysaccharide biosynthesis protein [bacterium]
MERAARHSALVIGAFLVTSVLNYVFGVGLSWFLQPAQYGVLGVAQSLLLLAALVVSAGFSWTANRDVAAGGVNAGTRTRFRTAWLANLALGALVAVALYTAYRLDFLALGPAYRAVVPLVGLTAIILAARAVVIGAAQGLYHFGAVAVNQVAEVAVKFGAGLLLVTLGYGAAGVMAAFALGAALALVHSLWIVRPARLWQGGGWFEGKVFSSTAPLFVAMLGPALMLNLDILGLKLLAPPTRSDEMAGFYQAAVILARIPVFTARSLTMVVFSYVAGAQRRPDAPDYARAALRLWQRLLLPAGIALALAPQAALTLFFPVAYLTAAPALRMAAVGGVLLSLVTLLAGIAQASGQRNRSASAAALATGVQILTLWWLVPQWGALGAAASLVTSGVVALLGMGALLPAPRATARNRLLQATPLLALALPLLWLPDGSRSLALLKFALSGLAYVLALLITQKPAGAPASTTSGASRWRSHLVHLLVGG